MYNIYIYIYMCIIYIYIYTYVYMFMYYIILYIHIWSPPTRAYLELFVRGICSRKKNMHFIDKFLCVFSLPHKYGTA